MVDAVLSASRSLIAVATRSLGAAAEETTIAQYRALVVLASRGPQRMVDLAAALGVTPSTAGRMCDRLVRKGLIRRHRARADRRAVLVWVTAAGRLVVDQATARRRALIEEMLANAAGGCPASDRGGATVVFGRGRGGTRQSVATAAWARRGGGPAAGRCSFRSGAARRRDRDGGERMAREGGRVAAGRPRRPVRPGARGGRGLRPGRGRVPVPDLLLHLAGHRA